MAPRHRITIAPDGDSFDCAADESILAALARQGRRGIPSGCQGGGCGVCIVAVDHGTCHTGPMSRAHVSADDQQAGLGLACRLYPRSDVTLQVVGKLRKAWQAKRLME